MNLVLYKDKLTTEQQDKHRAWIAIKSQALMARYYQISVDPLIKRDILKGWMDTLQDYSPEEIDIAIRKHIYEEPRVRPHEGMIREKIISGRKRVNRLSEVVKTDDRVLPSMERRKELVEEAQKTLKNTTSRLKRF